MKKVHSFSGLTRIIPVFFSLFIINTAYAQVNNDIFERITTKDGLPQSTVSYIIQDKKGFMWFATNGGINKYDGYTIKTYSNIVGDKNSLSNDGSIFIFEDKDGYIWIVNGFNAGLDKFDPVNESFTNYMNDPDDSTSISSNTIYSVMQDKSGNIWICTNNALNLVVSEKKGDNTITKFRRFYNVSFTGFLRAYEDRNGKLLLFADYLYSLDRKTNKIHKTIQLPFYAYQKLSISEDREGNLWLGNLADGVVKLVYNKKSQSYESVKLDILDGVATNNILIDYKDQVWIGTENKGLFCFDPKENRLQNFLNDKTDVTSISDNDVVSLCADRSGVLWIGTYTQGVCKYNLNRKEFYHFKTIPGEKNSLSGDAISSIHSTVPGELWVGVDLGGGINRFVFDNNKVQRVIHYKHNANKTNTIADDRILCLVQRKNGEVWAGSPGYLTKIIPEKPGTNNHPVIKNYNLFIWTFCIYEDTQGVLWGGTWGGGLWRYDDSADKFIFYVNDPHNPLSLCDNIVWTISEDTSGNIWIGGRDKGLSILTAKEKNKPSPQFLNFRHDEKKPNSLSNNTIQVISQDHTGTIWLGTTSGLNKAIIKDNAFKDTQSGTAIEFFAYHLKDGLPSEFITGILEDKHDNLWISTTNGLSKFSIKNNFFINYSESDGLQSNEFTHNAYFKDQNGRMYFGGFSGFNAFYPDSIKSNPFVPEVVFTDLKILNTSVKVGEKVEGDVILSKPVNDLSKIVLSHKNNVLTLVFAALHYTQTERNQYTYKLEGFDTDWNYVGNKREATYTNLNPGKYIFKVKASNCDGIWNNKYTSLAITILPPWWKTRWAKVFYLLLVVMALYFFRKYTLISANMKHQLMLEHIEKQKSEELSKMKIQFFTDISHELRTPLSLILSPLESLINTTSKLDYKNQLMLIYKNAERLYRLVNDLMDFSKVEDSKLDVKVQPGNIVKFTREIFGYFNEMALKQQIDYQFTTKYEEITSWFDSEKLERIIQNLISNAFKFTPFKGRIVVSVDKITPAELQGYSEKYIKGTEYVCISIFDSGLGIAPEYLDKIFDRFYQVPVKEFSHLKGTGVGLALTKSFVDLHHGFITVKSEPKKKTIFKVFIPLGNSHFKPSEIIEKPIDTVKLNDVKNLADGDSYMGNDLQVIKKGKPKLVVIENNLELREYLVSRLGNNYSVISTDNGRSGYEKIVKLVPDLIVSDILMPEVSGSELCKNIRENIAICHIPVILLTAKATIEDIIEGIETGADAYVTKPFNLRYLESVIRNLIESRKILYKRFSHDIYAVPKEIATNPLDQDVLEKAINYVYDNISDPDLSVEGLARFLFMSRRNAYRKIKALTNQSINDFIRILRLKKALKLIDERKLSISEIAFNVGFSSHAYFTKCFREQFGKSPSEYLSDNDTKTEDINIE
jgi:signal transduction histidine kinase/ligand-binding sensor domain-containing protein/CheY-like chemotaxis protein/AraC-like DNA-binding protein